MRPFSVVLLAAGGSSRLGSPKQMVMWEGQPLVARAVQTAIEADASEVVVVLGCEADRVREAVVVGAKGDREGKGVRLGPTGSSEKLPLQFRAEEGGVGANINVSRSDSLLYPLKFVLNENWRDGMGSSISVGASMVTSPALVLMLCDQPRVTSQLLTDLVVALAEDTPIAASFYDGRPGAPCAFDRSLFPDLMALQGDRGARDLIRDPSRRVAHVAFEDGRFDIDTPGDLG